MNIFRKHFLIISRELDEARGDLAVLEVNGPRMASFGRKGTGRAYRPKRARKHRRKMAMARLNIQRIESALKALILTWDG